MKSEIKKDTEMDKITKATLKKWGAQLFNRCRGNNLFVETTSKGHRNSGNKNSGGWNSGNKNSGGR